MLILVVDGQGGGVGHSLVEALLSKYAPEQLLAVGTNAVATANMLKGTSVRGATGENAVIYNASKADVIIGPIGIVLANSMFGEITPAMATAVASGDAQLILLPMAKCPAIIVGTEIKKRQELVWEAVNSIKENT